MTEKNCSDSKLLIRIDERTGYIQRDVKDLKANQGKIFDKLDKHGEAIAILKDEHKRNIHLPKDNKRGWFLSVLVWFFGK